MSIAQVEEALMAAVRATLGTRVRGVETIPGDWDDDMLKRFLQGVPGVFVAFTGCEALDAGGTEARIDARFAVYACTGHPTELARRRGDAMQVGAYQMLDLLVPLLHGLVVPDVGSLRLASVQNLFTGSIERQALTVYALVLSVPMTFEQLAAEDVLAPFLTFDGRIDVPPFQPAQYPPWLAGDYTGGKPDGHDVVSLPQETP